MAAIASTLYGTTSKSGSVPNACDACDAQATGPAGPVYSEDGKLILSESFNEFKRISNRDAFDIELKSLTSSDKFIETWRIWDCYAQAWANIDLALYRFETLDLVVNQKNNSVCAWEGAIDTQTRVLASQDPEENKDKCWQWLRA